MTGLLFVASFTVIFSMVAKRLSGTIVTGPMLFMGLGFILSETGLMPRGEAEASLYLVAEIALIILLFLDAAQIDLAALRQDHQWPVRMLTIGLPLTILLGFFAALPFLSGWPLASVALVAAILAPTDAALGQAVVSNSIIPDRVRLALSVESGVNDGIALIAVLLFASFAWETAAGEQTNWFIFGTKQLILGPVVGIGVGILAGKLFLFAMRLNFTSRIYEGIGALALAGIAYLVATLIGGNGFIAAFLAGLSFGNIVKGQCKFIYEFSESEGQLLSWAAFFLLGLVLMPKALTYLDLSSLALILLSLFVVRPIAIWISLVGTDASPMTRLFFGWFGPRGLATALFALLVLEKHTGDFAEPLLALAINAVWISALLHGMSAGPAAKWYAAKVNAIGDCPESQEVENPAKPLMTHD